MATIKDIKAALAALQDLDDPGWAVFADDPRKGVQTAIQQRKKAIAAQAAEDQRLEGMLRYEKAFYERGLLTIGGVDEVGRGPLAGPVVAACVVLPQGHKIRGLNDSKKIPKKRHQALYQQIVDQAVAVGVGIVSNDIIDRINIYQATKQAMSQAIQEVQQQVPVDGLLIDAMTLDLDLPQEAIIKGDANSLSIAAASIVAKVTRDQLMADYDRTFPGYDFAQNAGYGTAAHLEGLRRLGVTPIHRRTFEPIKSMEDPE